MQLRFAALFATVASSSVSLVARAVDEKDPGQIAASQNTRIMLICAKFADVTATRMTCEQWRAKLQQDANTFLTRASDTAFSIDVEVPSTAPAPDGWFQGITEIGGAPDPDTGQTRGVEPDKFVYDIRHITESGIDFSGVDFVVWLNNDTDDAGQALQFPNTGAIAVESESHGGEREDTLPRLSTDSTSSTGVKFGAPEKIWVRDMYVVELHEGSPGSGSIDLTSDIFIHELGHAIGLDGHYGTIQTTSGSRDSLGPFSIMGVSDGNPSHPLVFDKVNKACGVPPFSWTT